MSHERGQAWIRVHPYGAPRATSVWVCLGEGRMLLIKEDGSLEVTRDNGYCLPPRLDDVAIIKRIS